MHRCALFIFLLFLSALPFAEERPLSLAYEKRQASAAAENGRVFFDPHYGMYLFVDSPVCQRVVMNGDHFIYYYPEENVALKMTNREGTLSTAALQLFMYSDREDLGLQGLGFVLTGHETAGDTLVKIWEKRGKSRQEYMRLKVYVFRERVVKTISSDDKKELKRVFFSGWQERDRRYYPMNIRIREDGLDTDYSFKDLRFLTEIPDSVVRRFILPEDCEVYEYRW